MILASLAATAAYAASFKQVAAPLILGAALLSSTFPRRLRSDTTFEIAGAVLLGVAAWFLAGALESPPEEAMRAASFPAIRAFTSCWALLYTSLRLFLERPRFGMRGNALLVLIALLFSGGERTGIVYPASVAAFFCFAAAALRIEDPARSTLKSSSRRGRQLTVGAAALAAMLAVGFSLALPVLHDWALDAMVRAYASRAQTGFSVNMSLGSLSGMLQSDELVMRVSGPAPSLLRGVVYTRYLSGHWLAPQDPRPRPFADQQARDHSSKARTQIELLETEHQRLFLPLSFRNFRSKKSTVQIDDNGIVTAAGNVQAPVTYSFTTGSSRPQTPPDPTNLAVPSDLKAPLEKIVSRWTPHAPSKVEKLDSIVARLQENYSYSLEHEVTPGSDPVLDFLVKHTSGHCEYFASAAALLARAAGIPARVVGGYRVTERSPFTGDHLVRERNAHAWVEAWVKNRGWITIDPTPPGDLAAYMPSKSPLFSALTDLTGQVLRKLKDWFAARSATEIAALIAGLSALWIAVRFAQRTRKKRRKKKLPNDLEYTQPWPELNLLLQALSKRGHGRHENEPLEQYARRLQGADVFAKAAGDLIDQYAALRYGGQGNPSKLTQAIKNLTNQPTPERP